MENRMYFKRKDRRGERREERREREMRERENEFGREGGCYFYIFSFNYFG